MRCAAVLILLMESASNGRAFGQAYGELNIGDVRARFYANGRVGLGTEPGPSNFEVPLGGGASTLFAGGLWIGGTSSSGQVRLSRTFYDSNNDMNFFPGPLQVQWGYTDELTSQAYDRVWSVKRSDVARHLHFFNCAADPDCSVNTEFPNGYIIPQDIAYWPAMGNVSGGYAQYLAPFYDYNQDGVYNAEDGDAPCILGDQALFSVFSDYLSLANGNAAMRIEVQQMPFAFNSGDPMLDQTVFLRYHLINRSNQTYNNTMIGFFNDFDLGCANDDFIGCDPSRNLSYVYNWSDFDPTCLGAVGYGAQPPAFGMAVLKGPLLDADGQANSLGNALPEWNGQGFNDGVIDNERHGLSSFLYFNRASPNAATTDPSTPVHHYNYLRSIWKDGVPMSYGGNGYSTSPDAIPARFMFPGANDPVGAGAGGLPQAPWSDTNMALVDRRGVSGSGPITLEPGEHVDLLFAYVYARAGSGGAFASVAALQARVDSVRAFAQTLPIWDVPENQPYAGMCLDYATIGIAEPNAAQALSFYPSPAEDIVHFAAPLALVGGMLTLRDATGRMALQQRIQPGRNSIDVRALSRGVYLCEAVARNTRFSGRIVKE
jgi:hypothetical protein